MSESNDWLSEQLTELETFRKSPNYVPASEMPRPMVTVTNQRFQEVETVEPEVQVDPMQSVDQMIEQINCYRLLLNDSLFSGTLSPVAQVVENEIREFIVERIQILLGKRAPRVEAQFSEAEVKALKQIAKTMEKFQGKQSSAPSPVLNKTVIASKPAPPAPLRLNKVEGPKAEQSQQEVIYSIPASSIPQIVQPSVAPLKNKGGRPKGSQSKKIVSPKPIVDKNTGEVKYPVIETKGQVRPSGPVQPARMPAPNTVMPHSNEMIITEENKLSNHNY
jgi:hypothetical protein